MSRPKWLAVGKHSTNYQTRSQLSPSKRQHNNLYNIQSSHQPHRLSQLNFDTEGELDSPLYKTSEDRNLSSDGECGQMIGKRDYNRYLLKQSSDNVFMLSEGESNFPIRNLQGNSERVMNEKVMYQQMKDRQKHLPVYMKHNVSSSIREESSYQGNQYMNSLRNQQQQQPQSKISQQQQSIVIEEHQIDNDNYEIEEGNYRNYFQQQNSSAEGSEIIEAVSFVQQQNNTVYQNIRNNLLNLQNLQNRNRANLESSQIDVNYSSVISQESSSKQNILSRLSYQKQDSGVSPRNQQSDRSWHSHKLKINLSKEHHFDHYKHGQHQLESNINSNPPHFQSLEVSNKNRQILLDKIRHKLNEVNQLNNQLKIIKETIQEEIKFCQSNGRMELFLWDKIKNDRLFLDIRQRFLTGIQRIVNERVNSEVKLTNNKIKLKLSKPIISLHIPPLSKQSYNNQSNKLKESEYQEKINKLQNELQFSQLECSSLTSQKQSLQQQLFTVHQQLIGIEMQIQQRVRRQLRQLQLSLQTRIRQELKPQLEQSLVNSHKTTSYIQTIDTLTKQIQDLTNKCIHYENYIMQHQQINNSIQQQRNKQLQEQHDGWQSITNSQRYDQLFIQKMDLLQNRQQELNQVEKELVQMDAHLKQVQAQLNQHQNQLLTRETLVTSKEEEVHKIIEEINRRQQQLYNWQNQLQLQQNNITLKFKQFQLLKTQIAEEKPKPDAVKKTYYQYHQYNPNSSHQQIVDSNQQMVTSNQQTVNSPFFKYRNNKAELSNRTFTQSMITQKVKPTMGYRTDTLNPQNKSEKQSREYFLSDIKSKHRLQTEPLGNKEQIRQNKEAKYIPRKQGRGQVGNEMFSRSQVYSSTSNRPKSPILQYNPANQLQRQQRYTSTHNISMKDFSPANYYKHDRSAVYIHNNNQYNSTQDPKKLSNSYQKCNYFSSNKSNAITNTNGNKVNSHKLSLYSPKNNQYNPRLFNNTISKINKQTSYSNRSFSKQPLPASTISQKLQKLKQQIKREVKQLE